jgi:type IV secretory pathway TraG/TraD family ATPase VirD4
MLSAALARGDRAVIADPDGGYLSHFYDAERGDVILNPFEPDSMKWNLLGEITNEYDVDQLARSLIPDSGGSERAVERRGLLVGANPTWQLSLQPVAVGAIEKDTRLRLAL